MQMYRGFIRIRPTPNKLSHIPAKACFEGLSGSQATMNTNSGGFLSYLNIHHRSARFLSTITIARHTRKTLAQSLDLEAILPNL